MAGKSQVVLPVHGMSCASCAANVERTVKGLTGVLDVKVNLVAGKASIDYDPDKTLCDG